MQTTNKRSLIEPELDHFPNAFDAHSGLYNAPTEFEFHQIVSRHRVLESKIYAAETRIRTNQFTLKWLDEVYDYKRQADSLKNMICKYTIPPTQLAKFNKTITRAHKLAEWVVTAGLNAVTST
jgi:hypothetical protein